MAHSFAADPAVLDAPTWIMIEAEAGRFVHPSAPTSKSPANRSTVPRSRVEIEPRNPNGSLFLNWKMLLSGCRLRDSNPICTDRVYRRPVRKPLEIQGVRCFLEVFEWGGGEGGIRTPDRLAPMPHFECGAFDHSATSPGSHAGILIRRSVGASSRRGWRVRQGAEGQISAARQARSGEFRDNKDQTSPSLALLAGAGHFPHREDPNRPPPRTAAFSTASAGADPRRSACKRKGGTARRDKNRRSRVASLKLRPGSAASRASLSDVVTVAIPRGSATRSRS
jgi:hypothetical protein